MIYSLFEIWQLETSLFPRALPEIVMASEVEVRLLCPECEKTWQERPGSLPAHDDTFHCPNCHASRMMAEFMRTDHDLQTLKQLG